MKNTLTRTEQTACRAAALTTQHAAPRLFLVASRSLPGATYPVRVELTNDVPRVSHVGNDLVIDWASIVIARCVCPGFHRHGHCVHQEAVLQQFRNEYGAAWATLWGFETNDLRARNRAFDAYYRAARTAREARRQEARRVPQPANYHSGRSNQYVGLSAAF